MKYTPPILNTLTILFAVLLSGCYKNYTKTDNTPSNIFPEIPAAKIDKLYVFGDSLSDNGNLMLYLDHFMGNHDIRLQAPPTSSKGNGRRFTNGFLMVEYLASHYGIKLLTAWSPEPLLEGLGNNLTDEQTLEGISLLLNTYKIKSSSDAVRDFYSKIQNIQHHLSKTDSLLESGYNYAVGGGSLLKYYPDQFELKTVFERFLNRFTLNEQIDLHIKRVPHNNIEGDRTLHFIMIGANDISLITKIKSYDENQKSTLIKSAVDEYIKQIKKLKQLGAKKILVSGPPKIGNTPRFYPNPEANKLSVIFSDSIEKIISENFSDGSVVYVSLIPIFDRIQEQWQEEYRYIGCLSDFLDGYFDLRHFISTRGEIPFEFQKECSQKDLDEGEFMFFDMFHATDPVCRKVTIDFIEATNSIMKSK